MRGSLEEKNEQEDIMERYILSHDMGTSSDKAVLVDYKGSIKATAVEPYPTYYPNPAWV